MSGRRISSSSNSCRSASGRVDPFAKPALIPLENKRNFMEVTGEIMEHVDPIFFGDPKTAAFKALGLN